MSGKVARPTFATLFEISVKESSGRALCPPKRCPHGWILQPSRGQPQGLHLPRATPQARIGRAIAWTCSPPLQGIIGIYTPDDFAQRSWHELTSPRRMKPSSATCRSPSEAPGVALGRGRRKGLQATLFFLISNKVQSTSAMNGPDGKRHSRGEEKGGGTRASGSHCGRDARAPMPLR
jgi:hypothetical protein